MRHNYCNEFARTSHAIAGAGLPAHDEPGMPASAGTGLTRRSMLLRSLATGMAVYGGSALLTPEHVEAAINDAQGRHKVVISVYFGGGWDALSLLVPYGAPYESYARALRPTLLAQADEAATRALPFAPDPGLFWNPAAAGIKALWDDPNVGVAVAPAAGYPSDNQSHFTSQHFWEVGSLDLSGNTGWLGRYLDVVGSPDVPIQGVSMNGALSPTQATKRVPVAALESLKYSYLTWGVDGAQQAAYMRRLKAYANTATTDPALGAARTIARASSDLVDKLALANATAAPSTSLYHGATPTDMDMQLRDVAKLLDTQENGLNLPIRCVSMRAEGHWDTHANQVGEFPLRLKNNCDAIRDFWADLQARGQDDRVVMLLWSEFGRRAKENASGGSDHGAAGTAMVIGKGVRQGMLGEFPGIAPYSATGTGGLTKDGNLRYTQDFRAIQSAIMGQWLQADPNQILPGAGGLVIPQLF